MAYAEDLSVFLADFGVPCIFGAQQFLALPGEPDELVNLQRASGHSREYSITYRTDQATLARGAAGTVDGVAYTVREVPRQLGDGAFTQAMLTRT